MTVSSLARGNLYEQLFMVAWKQAWGEICMISPPAGWWLTCELIEGDTRRSWGCSPTGLPWWDAPESKQHMVPPWATHILHSQQHSRLRDTHTHTTDTANTHTSWHKMYTHFFLSFIKKLCRYFWLYLENENKNFFIQYVSLTIIEALMCCDMLNLTWFVLCDLYDNNNQLSYIIVQVASSLLQMNEINCW